MKIDELKEVFENLSAMGELLSTPMGEKWLEHTLDIKDKDDIWLILEQLYLSYVKSGIKGKIDDWVLGNDIETSGLWEQIRKECKLSNKMRLLSFLNKNIPLPDKKLFEDYPIAYPNSKLYSNALEIGIEKLSYEEQQELIYLVREFVVDELNLWKLRAF